MPAKDKQQQDRAVVAQAEPQRALTVVEATRTVERDLVNKQGDLAKALAGRYDPDWFTSAVASTFRRSPGLWEVAATDAGRASVIQSVIEAAQIGLPFLMGRAYLVPFYNTNSRAKEAQLIIGYQGLVDKVTGPSTGVTFAEAAVVYAKDHFDYRRGTGGYLHHREYMPPAGASGADLDRGPRVAVWARVVFANGQDRWEVFGMADVERIRAMSKTANTGPWKDHYDEMCKKTVLRNLCKTLRMDFQLMQMLDKEDAWEGAGRDQPAAGDGQQSKLRQQLQSKLTQDDAQLDEPAGSSQTPPPADTAATDAQTSPQDAPLWQPMDQATSAQLPVVCGHGVVGPDGNEYSCTLAPKHKGRHSDGQHDWD